MSSSLTTCGSTSADFRPFLIGASFAAAFFVATFPFVFFAMLSSVERPELRTADCTRGGAGQTVSQPPVESSTANLYYTRWRESTEPGALAIDDKRKSGAIGVRARGADVLRDPLLNKGTGFSAEERQRLGLEGLLPFKTVSQEQQAARIYEQLQAQPDPLQ